MGLKMIEMENQMGLKMIEMENQMFLLKVTKKASFNFFAAR